MTLLVRGEDSHHSVNLKMRVTIQLLTPMTFLTNLTTFFVNVGPKLASSIQNTGKNYFDYLHDMKSNSMFMKPIVELEIMKIVDQLKPNKSAGHDKIGNFIIKKVSDEIVKPLTCIFNLSLSTGIVPENLKVAKVIPIYKKDDAAVFSNYRPVSLLPCFSKILERLVFSRCVDYINTLEILNDKQFGFSPKAFHVYGYSSIG